MPQGIDLSGLICPDAQGGRQPQGPVALNREYPYADKVLALFHAGNSTEVVSGRATCASAITRKLTTRGIGVISASVIISPVASVGTGPLTDFVLLDCGGNPALYSYGIGSFAAGECAITLRHNPAGHVNEWGALDTAIPGGGLLMAGEFLPTSGIHLLVHTRDGTTHRIYRDGVLRASVAAGSTNVGAANLVFNGYTTPTTLPVLLSGRIGAALSPSEVAALAANPWQLFDAPLPLIVSVPGGAAGGAADLAGTIAAQASASGSLTTAIPLTGAAAVVATSTGAISTAIPLAGLSAAATVAGGTLTAQITLTGSALAQALAGGDLTTGIRLAGSAQDSASATGALTGSAAQLAGVAAEVATAAASLTTQISLSGAAITQALASANLTATPTGLSGAASAQAGATGALLTQIPLAGAAQAYATSAAGLTTVITLAAVAASISSATGALTLAATLTGIALSQATAAGSLTIRVQMNGAALAQADAAGSLGGTPSLTARVHAIRALPRSWTVSRPPPSAGSWVVSRDRRDWRIAA